MPLSFPSELHEITEALSRRATVHLVGGCVRDALLGLEPDDFDIEVHGMDYDELKHALSGYGPTEVVGRAFGVVKVRRNGRIYDFSLPRREVKVSAGHRGFEVIPDRDLSFRDAAARRDFTINAIAYDPARDRIIDPFDGVSDLKDRILRHTGPSFAEDPLRVLRGFQLAARFDLNAVSETIDLCRSMYHTYEELPVERVWMEWEKWARQAVKPSAGLRFLNASGWIGHFPELAALEGVPQDPEWHPEGDVLTHTLLCTDALAALSEWKRRNPFARASLMLAALSHDFGKAVTTGQVLRKGRLRWTSPGHEGKGGELAESFLRRIGAPRSCREYVRPLVENHLFHLHAGDPPSMTAVRRLAARLHPASITDLCLLIRADQSARPPAPAGPSSAVLSLERAAETLELQARAPKPLIKGRHLIDEGLEPGPSFGRILNDLFEAQLDGEFSDEASGRDYLRRYLAKHGMRMGDTEK